MLDAILWTKVLKILKMILITERFFWSLIMNSQLELKNFLSQDGESKIMGKNTKNAKNETLTRN